MAVHAIKRGLDLPISGAATDTTTIHDAPVVAHVALVAEDYPGLKPGMLVTPGDVVKVGDKLAEDRKSPGVFFTAMAAGTVKAVNRGKKRVLQTVVIELSSTPDAAIPFASFAAVQGKDGASLAEQDIRALLTESGLWTAFRTRPYSRPPTVDAEPAAIFITATDTHPLAPDPEGIIKGHEAAFDAGMAIIAKLCHGNTYLCTKGGSALKAASGTQKEEFVGKHPAGTPGVHIHTLRPVDRNRSVWHVGYQDVLAIAQLFSAGTLRTDRVVALAGPGCKTPRLLRTRLGASLDDLTVDETVTGETRTISGSVLSGRAAQGDVLGFLGRYHNQISVLQEDRERVFLGWLLPGMDKFSVVNTFISKLMPGKKFDLSTSSHGEHRPMVPIGVYEKVFPMDIMPTFLLRAIAMDDIETAEKLGVLELDEEDLSLCTFVDPCKNNWGPMLRRNLTIIEKEG